MTNYTVYRKTTTYSGAPRFKRVRTYTHDEAKDLTTLGRSDPFDDNRTVKAIAQDAAQGASGEFLVLYEGGFDEWAAHITVAFETRVEVVG